MYKFIGVKQDNIKRTYQLNSILQNGTDRHKRLQEAMLNMKKFKYINVASFVKRNKIKNLKVVEESDFSAGRYETHLHYLDDSGNPLVSFLCDGLGYDGRKHFVIEIKTMSSAKWNKAKDVLEEHKNQGIAYCALLHVKSILFVYENRDFLGIKTFLFTPSFDEITNFWNTLDRLVTFKKENIIPKKPVVDKNICKYCAYRKSCFSNENEHIAELEEYYEGVHQSKDA